MPIYSSDYQQYGGNLGDYKYIIYAVVGIVVLLMLIFLYSRYKSSQTATATTSAFTGYYSQNNPYKPPFSYSYS